MSSSAHFAKVLSFRNDIAIKERHFDDLILCHFCDIASRGALIMSETRYIIPCCDMCFGDIRSRWVARYRELSFACSQLRYQTNDYVAARIARYTLEIW